MQGIRGLCDVTKGLFSSEHFSTRSLKFGTSQGGKGWTFLTCVQFVAQPDNLYCSKILVGKMLHNKGLVRCDIYNHYSFISTLQLYASFIIPQGFSTEIHRHNPVSHTSCSTVHPPSALPFHPLFPRALPHSNRTTFTKCLLRGSCFPSCTPCACV